VYFTDGDDEGELEAPKEKRVVLQLSFVFKFSLNCKGNFYSLSNSG
jgi:hypothetical protein